MTKTAIRRVYQGCDLAVSTKNSADYFCIVTIGISEDGKIFVLNVFREKGISFHNQINAIIKKSAEWRPLKIAVENNSYQAVLSQELQRLTLLPIVPITTLKDKIMRAQGRSALVETHRVYVAHNMHSFTSELVMLDPNGSSEHDDQFDSLDLALTVSETVTPEYTGSGDYFVPEFDNF